MPYVSKKQERYFNWAGKHGKMKPSVVNEFNQASKGMKLPEYAKKHQENMAKARATR